MARFIFHTVIGILLHSPRRLVLVAAAGGTWALKVGRTVQGLLDGRVRMEAAGPTLTCST